MKAVLSGRACAAWLIDGDVTHSIHYDDLDQLVSRRPEEFRLVFSGVHDLEICENLESIDDVRTRLADAVDSTEALDLALYLCDSQLSDETLESAALELEEIIAAPEIALSLEQILFARPLPTPVDLQKGLAACETSGSRLTFEFLQRLVDRQATIQTVRLAWDAIPPERLDDSQRRFVEAICLRFGLFRDLVEEYFRTKRVDDSQLRWSTDAALRRELPSIAGLLNEWSRVITGTPSRQSSIHVNRTQDDEPDNKTERRSQKGSHRGLNRNQILQKVNSQKDLIVDAMRQADSHRAFRLIDELVSYQTELGGAQYICRSLCDLAFKAQDLGQFDLQFKLTSRSVAIKPDDCWSCTQHGKALLNLGLYEEALVAYGQAADYRRLSDDDAVIRNGRAEVLKAMGDFDAALAEYDAVRKEHPENVVARNGRAEVLKAMGDFDAALAEFDAIRKEHPRDVFARTGRAEVLKTMGDFKAALAEYDAVRKEHPENVVARNGRAEVLKTMGDFKAALAEYEAVRKEHPKNVVARNGRAVVLSLLQRWDEALSDLPTAPGISRGDWIGYHIRGMILLRRGKTDEAVQIFETGVRDCPFPDDTDAFRTALVTARFRQRRFAEGLEVLTRMTHSTSRAQVDVLRVHAFGELKLYQDAKSAHDRWPPARTAFDDETFKELERRYIYHQPAAHDDDWLIDHEICFLQQAA